MRPACKSRPRPLEIPRREEPCKSFASTREKRSVNVCRWMVLFCLLTFFNAGAVPGNLSAAQTARLRKSRLVVLVPNYLPQGFVLTELECNSLQYRLVYKGPAKARFWICGRGAGVCDGGPGDYHYAVTKGPLTGSVVEFNKEPGRTGFYTGLFLIALGSGGIVESLLRLSR